MVFVFSSQHILKPLDIKVSTGTLWFSDHPGLGAVVVWPCLEGGQQKTVVFCVLSQLEAITVSSGRSQKFLLHAAEKTGEMGKRTPVCPVFL